MLGRLLLIVAVLATIAVVTPRFAPDLLEGFFFTPAGDSEAVAARSADPVPGYGRQAALRADPQGHFVTNAVVNGRSLEMLIDTGATIVALTGESARRLGIYPARAEFTLVMSTANGPVTAAPVTLREIRIGDVSVRDVPAVVFSGDVLETDLLGMTFLKRLSRFEAGGGRLVLVQ